MVANDTDKIITFFREIDHNLETLWDALCEKRFLYQEGSYPAGHGQTHIFNVIRNLKKFLTSCGSTLPLEEKATIIAAAMIHDINMIPLRSQGSEGPKSDALRINHALSEQIKILADKILLDSGFNDKTQRDNIIEIASAHAGDSQQTPDQKICQLDKRGRDIGNELLKKMAVLVQASDFFDIGPGRLTLDVKHQKWNHEQIEHYKKHVTVSINIMEKDQCIKLWLNKEEKIEVDGEILSITPMEKYKIIYIVNKQACNTVDKLNKEFNTRWRVDFDRSILGEISPMGKGVDLFTNTLISAHNDWPDKRKPFPVDIIGHSLYGRFVDDEEGLNQELIRLLKSTGMDLRLIILDPCVENQQMCEVYDGQRNIKHEKDRSILPLYKSNRNIAEKGDIHSSLDVLNQWLENVGLNSSMEFRATTRMMYMSLTRFGNSLIVTPYRQKGLFNDSISILFKNNSQNDSPLFNAYSDVFENIWNDRFETMLMGYKNLHNKHNNEVNPVVSLLPDQQGTERFKEPKPFDYERFFLSKYRDRMEAVFRIVRGGSKQAIPPIEVEIQPSEDCILSCEHCIGRHINQKKHITEKTIGKFDTLLNYTVGNYKIERFRISGLIGDPLSQPVREATLDFIKKANKQNREVVLLTNGVYLDSNDPRLLLSNYIHVSLDAATSDTFKSLKGVDLFGEIKNNILSLCHAVKLKQKNTKVGIGFVVTQSNFFEVLEAITLAKELGVSFIRFKPDIRGMQAIAWRNWKEAVSVIKNCQLAEKDNAKFEIIITDTGNPHHRIPVIDRCWSQYFYSTIGADNQIYPCDHLTTTQAAMMGDCRQFNIKWEHGVNNNIIGQRHRQCVLCPPFSWRLNRLVSQLYHLYVNQDCNWGVINQWITTALHSQPPLL